MKNSRLIEVLGEMNKDADVSLTTSEDICVSYIGDDKNTTEKIFIEPSDFCESCVFYDESYCMHYEMACDDVDECYNYLRDD